LGELGVTEPFLQDLFPFLAEVEADGNPFSDADGGSIQAWCGTFDPIKIQSVGIVCPCADDMRVS